MAAPQHFLGHIISSTSPASSSTLYSPSDVHLTPFDSPASTLTSLLSSPRPKTFSAITSDQDSTPPAPISHQITIIQIPETNKEEVDRFLSETWTRTPKRGRPGSGEENETSRKRRRSLENSQFWNRPSEMMASHPAREDVCRHCHAAMDSYNIARHLQSHCPRVTDKRVWQCQNCQTTFCRKDVLLKHLRTFEECREGNGGLLKPTSLLPLPKPGGSKKLPPKIPSGSQSVDSLTSQTPGEFRRMPSSPRVSTTGQSDAGPSTPYYTRDEQGQIADSQSVIYTEYETTPVPAEVPLSHRHRKQGATLGVAQCMPGGHAIYSLPPRIDNTATDPRIQLKPANFEAESSQRQEFRGAPQIAMDQWSPSELQDINPRPIAQHDVRGAVDHEVDPNLYHSTISPSMSGNTNGVTSGSPYPAESTTLTHNSYDDYIQDLWNQLKGTSSSSRDTFGSQE